MAGPAPIDIIADRNVPFVSNYSFLDADWTGSSFKMQVRKIRDTTGTALLTATSGGGSIVLTYAGTATVAAHIVAGRLTSDIYGLINAATGAKFTPSDSVLLSAITIGFDTATMEAFPLAEQPGDDLPLAYDIIRTPASGPAELIMRGSFTVRAGVTIP